MSKSGIWLKPLLPLSPTAAYAGKRAAQLLFEARGGHYEVHLRKDELALVIAHAVDLAHRNWANVERLAKLDPREKAK